MSTASTRPKRGLGTLAKSTIHGSRQTPPRRCNVPRGPPALNMSGPFDQRRPPALPVEHVAWRLQRGSHSVEAQLRQHPLGIEFVCVYDGAPLWSEVFTTFQPAIDLDRALDDTRNAWEAKGRARV